METLKQLPEAPEKWVCSECGEVSQTYLEAPSPFNADDTLIACPECLEVGVLSRACQHEGCVWPASGGHLGGEGYRYFWSCWEHSPKNPENS